MFDGSFTFVISSDNPSFDFLRSESKRLQEEFRAFSSTKLDLYSDDDYFQLGRGSAYIMLFGLNGEEKKLFDNVQIEQDRQSDISDSSLLISRGKEVVRVIKAKYPTAEYPYIDFILQSFITKQNQESEGKEGAVVLLSGGCLCGLMDKFVAIHFNNLILPKGDNYSLRLHVAGVGYKLKMLKCDSTKVTFSFSNELSLGVCYDRSTEEKEQIVPAVATAETTVTLYTDSNIPAKIQTSFYWQKTKVRVPSCKTDGKNTELDLEAVVKTMLAEHGNFSFVRKPRDLTYFTEDSAAKYRQEVEKQVQSYESSQTNTGSSLSVVSSPCAEEATKYRKKVCELFKKNFSLLAFAKERHSSIARPHYSLYETTVVLSQYAAHFSIAIDRSLLLLKNAAKRDLQAMQSPSTSYTQMNSNLRSLIYESKWQFTLNRNWPFIFKRRERVVDSLFTAKLPSKTKNCHMLLLIKFLADNYIAMYKLCAEKKKNFDKIKNKKAAANELSAMKTIEKKLPRIFEEWLYPFGFNFRKIFAGFGQEDKDKLQELKRDYLDQLGKLKKCTETTVVRDDSGATSSPLGGAGTSSATIISGLGGLQRKNANGAKETTSVNLQGQEPLCPYAKGAQSTESITKSHVFAF